MSEGFFVSRFKDPLILAGWIAGLVLVGGLCWFLTGSVRTGFLMDSINRALVLMEDPRRLEEPIAPGTVTLSTVFRGGQWFNLEGEENQAFFFTLAADGSFFPCVAIVSPLGKVNEIIPLSKGKKNLRHVSPGIIRLYIRRIEGEP